MSAEAIEGTGSRNMTRPSAQTLSSLRASRGLITNASDTWLIGGASIVVYILFTIAGFYRGNAAVDRQFSNLATAAGTLSLLVNYPHFMVSYKIAYGRGWRFALKHWFQLIAVPILLIGLFALSYMTFSDPNRLPSKFNPLNLNAGEGIATLLIMTMFLTVGWHYIKQTFGCMMVFGSLDEYHLSRNQRRLLLTLLYSMALLNFFGSQIGPVGISNFYGFRLLSLGLPQEFHLFIHLIFAGLVCAFAYGIVWKNWQTKKRWPSMNFMVPLVALVVWWEPLLAHPEYFLIVPFFHSLQYLPFAYRYEQGRNSALGKRVGVGTIQVIALLVIGFLVFEFVPYSLQASSTTPDLKRAVFFVVAAHVFVNIHHYFIDNAIWKFHHPEVQMYLLRRAPSLRLNKES